MSWFEIFAFPLLRVAAWFKAKAVVLLAIVAAVSAVAAFLAWTKSTSREAGFQQCRNELRVQQAQAEGERIARGAQLQLGDERAGATVFSLSRLDYALQLEADHVPILVPAAGARAAGCPAAAAGRPVRRAAPAARPGFVASQPGQPQRDPEPDQAEASQSGAAADDLVLSSVALCMWNAPYTASGGDQLPAHADAAAAAIAEACAAEGGAPSGVSVRDALKNHLTNATSCQQDRARLDELTAPLRAWQMQAPSPEK